MLLFINTNFKDKVYFVLSEKMEDKRLYKEYNCSFLNSEEILSFLNDFINLSNYKKENFFKNIKSIIIDCGPGINMNFRIGIIISNTIAYLYNINIINIENGTYNDVEEFLNVGWKKFNNNEFTKLAIPKYSIKK